jgi:hypothetical protein
VGPLAVIAKKWLGNADVALMDAETSLRRVAASS